MDEEERVMDVLEAEIIQQETRRQMTSIREAKETLKDILKTGEKEKMKFSQVYKAQNVGEKDVSPALCFLTLLHLANENNLVLTQN